MAISGINNSANPAQPADPGAANRRQLFGALREIRDNFNKENPNQEITSIASSSYGDICLGGSGCSILKPEEVQAKLSKLFPNLNFKAQRVQKDGTDYIVVRPFGGLGKFSKQTDSDKKTDFSTAPLTSDSLANPAVRTDTELSNTYSVGNIQIKSCGQLSPETQKKLAETLQKLNQEFTVKFPGQFQPVEKITLTRENYGYYSPKDRTINLSITQILFENNVEQTRETLIHEFGHALYDSLPEIKNSPEWKKIYTASLDSTNSTDFNTMYCNRYDETNYVKNASEELGHPYDSPDEFFASVFHAFYNHQDDYLKAKPTYHTQQVRLENNLKSFLNEQNIFSFSPTPISTQYSDQEIQELLTKFKPTPASPRIFKNDPRDENDDFNVAEAASKALPDAFMTETNQQKIASPTPAAKLPAPSAAPPSALTARKAVPVSYAGVSQKSNQIRPLASPQIYVLNHKGITIGTPRVFSDNRLKAVADFLDERNKEMALRLRTFKPIKKIVINDAEPASREPTAIYLKLSEISKDPFNLDLLKSDILDEFRYALVLQQQGPPPAPVI